MYTDPDLCALWALALRRCSTAAIVRYLEMAWPRYFLAAARA